MTSLTREQWEKGMRPTYGEDEEPDEEARPEVDPKEDEEE